MSLESRRAASVTAPSFSALKAASTAYTRKTGGSVIDFSIGSSNIPPSDSLKQVLADASLDDDVYQYNLGPSAQMLSTIQDWYQERYGCSLAENEIAVLKGSQEALSSSARISQSGRCASDPGSALSDLFNSLSDCRLRKLWHASEKRKRLSSGF